MMQQFWSKVARGAPNECWLWTASVKENKPGRDYGVLQVNGRRVRAHRFAYALTYGPITCGLHVLHRCDTPRCCNPAHLFLGTHLDNMRDMIAKNRRINLPRGKQWLAAHPKERRAKNGIPMPGESNPNAVLAEIDVRSIKAELKRTGGVRGICVALAAQFGVTPDAIRKIKQGRNWPHVNAS